MSRRSACKPNFVPARACARAGDGHFSVATVASRLASDALASAAATYPRTGPARPRPHRLFAPGQGCPHIWSCCRWGLPCRGCRHPRGALLPHRFTLTGVVGSGQWAAGGNSEVREDTSSGFPAHCPLSTAHRPGGLFSVALSVGFVGRCRPPSPPGRYPAPCPAQFGLSSRGLVRRGVAPATPRPRGRPAGRRLAGECTRSAAGLGVRPHREGAKVAKDTKDTKDTKKSGCVSRAGGVLEDRHSCLSLGTPGPHRTTTR